MLCGTPTFCLVMWKRTFGGRGQRKTENLTVFMSLFLCVNYHTSFQVVFGGSDLQHPCVETLILHVPRSYYLTSLGGRHHSFESSKTVKLEGETRPRQSLDNTSFPIKATSLVAIRIKAERRHCFFLDEKTKDKAPHLLYYFGQVAVPTTFSLPV